MERRRRIEFDRIWVCVSRGTDKFLSKPRSDCQWFVVALHKVLSKMNKMDRLLIFFLAFNVEIDGIL